MDTLNFNSPEAQTQLNNNNRPNPGMTTANPYAAAGQQAKAGTQAAPVSNAAGQVPRQGQPNAAPGQAPLPGQAAPKGGRMANEPRPNLGGQAAGPRIAGTPLPPPPERRFPAEGPRQAGRQVAPQTGGNNTAARVAVGVGAAAVAAGATAATMAAINSDEEISLDDQIVDAGTGLAEAAAEVVTPEEETPEASEATASSATPGAASGGHAGAATSDPANDIVLPEPDGPAIPDPDDTYIPDPDDPFGPDYPFGPGEPVEPFEPEPIADPEDVDEIADSIIAQDQIDTNDINPDEMFAFNDIDTVYTVDGDVQTMAAFTSDTGDSLVMVDIDNDGLFDRIETPEGFYVADASEFHLTASDAEVMAQGEGYVAQSDTEIEHFDETLGDEYLDDIIDV